MAQKLYNDTAVQDIADAIREKNGQPATTKYKIAEMGPAIRAIPSGGGEKTAISNNGIQYLFSDYRPVSLLDNIEFKNLTTLTKLFYACRNNSTFQPVLSQIGVQSSNSIESISSICESTSSVTEINLNGPNYNVNGVNADNAFYNSLHLVTVTGLPKISTGTSMFESSQQLKTVNIPAIANNAQLSKMFKDCIKLVNLTLPQSAIGVYNSDEMFYNCKALTSLDLSNWSFRDSISLQSMFYGCRSLANLTLPQFGKVTNCNQMFYGCIALTNLDLKMNWSSLTGSSAGSMFRVCSGLKTLKLDIDTTSTSTAVDMSYFIERCSSLETLHFGGDNVDPAKISLKSNTFTGCTALKDIVFNHRTDATSKVFSLTATNILSPIPADCKFYVPDAVVDNYKTATNWSARAAYIFPLSEYVES